MDRPYCYFLKASNKLKPISYENNSFCDLIDILESYDTNSKAIVSRDMRSTCENCNYYVRDKADLKKIVINYYNLIERKRNEFI